MEINLKYYENDYYGFIYETINLINGKKYIGQKKFSKGYEDYLGSGVVFYKALNKYGKENFERKILAIGKTSEILDDLEKYFIKINNAVEDDNYYNISTGGHNGNNFAGKTKEEKKEFVEKVSNGLKKYYEENPGVVNGENNGFYGKHHSEEVRKKISEFMSGENNPCYGIPRSKETKDKLSKSIKKYYEKHPETKQKIREKVSGENHPSSKKVIELDINNLSFIKIYGSMREASRETGVKNHNMVSHSCKTGKIIDGHLFIKEEDYIDLLQYAF